MVLFPVAWKFNCLIPQGLCEDLFHPKYQKNPQL